MVPKSAQNSPLGAIKGHKQQPRAKHGNAYLIYIRSKKMEPADGLEPSTY